MGAEDSLRIWPRANYPINGMLTKRFLVTGAQGFVGRYVVSRLLSSHSEITVLGVGRSRRLHDTFTHSVSWKTQLIPAPLPEELKTSGYGDRYQYASIDIRDRMGLSEVLRSFRPQVLIHLASGLRDDPPDYLFRLNFEGTIHLVESIKESGIEVPRLIICSTGGVYGSAGVPIKESSSCMPADLYSASKLAAEHASRILTTQYEIPTMWARLFNLVGAGQDERHACGRFASTVAAILKKELPPVIKVGRLDTTRDFVNVLDVADALELLSEKGTPGEVYNVGSGTESSIRSVLDTLLSLAGLEGSVKVEQTEHRVNDIARHFADIGRLRSLGFQPKYDLGQSLEQVLLYYLGTVAETAR
jgi:GDP-4-dehydro-6-deoxy-D-mannose reductase